MMREVIRTAKAMLNERKRPLSEWIVVIPAIQWALNTAYRRRMAGTPFQLMMRRDPRTEFKVLVEEDLQGVQVTPVEGETLRQKVARIVAVQNEMLSLIHI